MKLIDFMEARARESAHRLRTQRNDGSAAASDLKLEQDRIDARIQLIHLIRDWDEADEVDRAFSHRTENEVESLRLALAVLAQNEYGRHPDFNQSWIEELSK